MIFANQEDREKYYKIKGGLTHGSRAHASVMTAMSHLQITDPLFKLLENIQCELFDRITRFEAIIKDIELRGKEHEKETMPIGISIN